MTSNLASQKLACIIILTGFFLVVFVVIFLWNGVVMMRSYQDNRTILLTSNIEFSSHIARSAPELHLYEVSNDLNDSTPEPKSGGSYPASSSESSSDSETNVEYVQPVKIVPSQDEEVVAVGHHKNSLENEDPMPLLRHHSGHYRHQMAPVWDPHPEYEFRAFGQLFHLNLALDSSFVAPNIEVTHVFKNTTTREVPRFKPDGCFYSGTVQGDSLSSVAVNLCSGMRGHIKTAQGSYFIEPIEKYEGGTNASPIKHLMYRIPTLHMEPANHCGLDSPDLTSKNYDPDDTSDDATRTYPNRGPVDENETLQYVGSTIRVLKSHDLNNSTPDEETDTADRLDKDKHRRKRSTSSMTPDDALASDFHRVKQSDPGHQRRKRGLSQEYFIELMIVADRKMAEYHGSELQTYVLTLMAIVSLIFKDASIGNPVTIAVVKLYVLNDVDLVPRKPGERGISANALLKRFCSWQHHMNDANDDSSNHHDTALLLTREKLCHVDRETLTIRCETLINGLAELGTMCDTRSSCSLVHDNGLSSAFTIAHELGHVLNIPHDDDAKCLPFQGSSAVSSNVMSRALDNNTYPWSWSNCSRHYLTEYLDAGNGDCLRDEPTKDYLSEGRQHWPPGENFNGDRQCELLYGKGVRVCSYMPVCQRLWCTNSEAMGGCRTQLVPWADGTLCHPDGSSSHWCQRGACVVRNPTSLMPRNGGWGPWGSFGSCSRPCGGGIQKAYRECDSPASANGGKYCVGRRVQHRSCNTQDCPAGALDFREEQCVKFNGNNFSVPGLSRDVRWSPKYLGGDNACKLYCRVSQSSAYYLLKDKVIDGTPCGPDTFNMCVNGKCLKAGCDHVLDSQSALDSCGVCLGNNRTCQEVTGTHNSSHYGYTRVLRIPAGSSNLDITQYGYRGSSSDDNYLALSDGETNEPILNGKNVVSKSHKVIVFGGISIDYTGTDAVVERINCSRPLTKELVVEVLSVGNLYPPNIHYRYTVQKGAPDKYKWSLAHQWTSCTKVCNGEARRDPVCIRIEDNIEVADHLCPYDEVKPSPETRPCNNHCVLKWQVISQSECSAHCGPGTRSVSLQCVQHFLSSYSPPLPLYNSTCAHLARPPDREPCQGPCNAARWSFSAWGTCSKSCGTGVETRSAVCIDDFGREVDESQCAAAEKIIQRVCGTSKCPQWSVGEWSACSVSCGKGERSRLLWCQRDNQVVHNSYCSAEPTPSRKESCYMPPCPEWIAGQFSACSVTCGEGTAIRDVRCNLGDDNACASLPKPPSVETCVVHPCDDYVQADNDIPDSRYEIQDPAYFLWRHGHWSSCSASCGEGEKKRSVGCYNKNTGKQVDENNCPFKTRPASREPCKVQPCASWRSSEWSACSSSCGQGLMRRKVQCVDSSNQDQVEEQYCLDPRPVEEVQCYGTSACVKPSTYNWRTTRWSECSASCGGGTRRRSVECYNEKNQLGRTCDPGTKPESSTPCNEHPCIDGDWIFGGWTECNSTCGGGHQHRQVECQDPAGVTLPEARCHAGSQPQREQPCNTQPCVQETFRWKAGAWGLCNRLCGQGEQTRKLVCVSAESGRLADPVHCQGLRKPKTEKPCRKAPCSVDWVATEWSSCSVSCGSGIQTRDFTCRRMRDSTALPPYRCAGSVKPPAVRACQMEPCAANSDYSWVPGPWQDCSHPCGKDGRQVRKLYCYHVNGKRVNRSLCDRKLRPPKKRLCNQKKCGVTSCREVREKQGVRQDGEYTISVLGRSLNIFCHRMNTTEPKEYLTLHSEADNFAEKYDRRLLDPDTCPYKGARDDSCRCVDSGSDSGITSFYKIRLNITSLKVNTKDFTFSRQRKGEAQAYGEAGDCYSRVRCPQGQFSIDLTGTGFMVARETTWVAHGPGATVEFHKLDGNRKVMGRCGGYCGHCGPSNGLKLDILPP